MRAHRRRLGLTQEELAERAGVSISTVGKIEAGRIRGSRPATVRLMAAAFGLTGAERDRFCQLASDRAEVPDSASAEASTSDQAMARQAVSTWPVPAQLPTDIADFVGRSDQLTYLERALGRVGQERSATVPVCAIVGPPGVGKTALAVRAAHRLCGVYVDGQLFAD